jgi:N-methylhydantoinase B
MGPAEEILQEGIRIPVVRIVRGGQVDREMLNLILLNECTSQERKREGDLDAQIGACRVGERRILEVAEKYGERRLHALIDELLDYFERLVRAELRKMPAGEFSAENWLDDDDVTDVPRKIAVRLELNPGVSSIHVDFASSSPQVAGSVNAVRAITLSACFYVMRCLLQEDAPATAGVLRPLSLNAPAGSIVEARPPAAVAGNVETSPCIVGVLLRAVGQGHSRRIPVTSAGTVSNLTLGR